MRKMVRNLKASIILFIVLAFSGVGAYALPLVDFGFQGGLSTPNDKIGEIYNKNTIAGDSGGVRQLYSKGVDAGYYIGAKVRFHLSDNVNFTGSFGLNKFPQSTIEVRDPKDPGKVLTELKATTNVVPISAGISMYLFKSFIGVYGCGDLSYNYVTSSVDYKYNGVQVPISTTPSNSRLGFGLGAGVDVNLGLLLLNLEGKYNYMNLIGKESSESDKNYFNLCLGVYF